MAGRAIARAVCAVCLAVGVAAAQRVQGQAAQVFDIRDLQPQQADDLLADRVAAMERVARAEFGEQTRLQLANGRPNAQMLVARGDASVMRWVTDVLAQWRGGEQRQLHFEVSIVRVPVAAARELKFDNGSRLQLTPPQAADFMQRLLKADKVKLINLPPIEIAPLVPLHVDAPAKAPKDKPATEPQLQVVGRAFPAKDGGLAVDLRLLAPMPGAPRPKDRDGDTITLVSAVGLLPPGQVLLQAQFQGDGAWILQVRSREEPPKK
ncbi:MAG TPA: hypothetical protein VK348_12740 [Planctomycetota bacterium]|nr:hypothetical protein [Planctomycetota bacterium]